MGNKLMPLFYPSKSEGKTNKLRGSSFVSTLRRSASLRSLRRMSWMPRPHLDCRSWLTQLELTQYLDNFSKFGGVEDLLYYDEQKITDLGVNMSSHLSRIMSSLNNLREKYEKNQKLKVDPNPRASLIEVEEAKKLKLRLDIDPDVVLRHGSRSPSAKPNPQKREGALLSPSEFEKAKMSFDKAKNLPSNKPEGGPDEEELKKLLELELSLDSADLRSHTWYHGSIPRLRAEEVVSRNECFIVRDCISQPGNYVLTCRWKNNVIHVVIQKTTVQPNTIYEHVQFIIEDEAFDSVPDLITAYVGGRKPVTIHSGAIITKPINRTLPLSFYLSKYEAQTEHTKIHGTLSRPVAKPPHMHQRATHPYFSREPVGVGCTVVRTTSHSPPRMRRGSGSSNSSSGHRPSSGVFEERCNSSDGVIGPRKTNKDMNTFTSQSLPRRFQTPALSLPPQSLEINLDTFTPVLQNAGPELQQVPPPKPSRVPSIKIKPKKPPANPGERIYAEIDEEDEGNPKSIETEDKTPTESGFDKDPTEALNAVDTSYNPRHSRISEVYNPSGSDSGNGSGDSVQTSTSDSRNRDSQVSLGDSSFILVEDDSLVDDETSLLTLPDLYPTTSFDLENFSTLLLPSIENKPLDFTALKGIRNMLTESGSRILAAHLTRCDLDLLNGYKERDLGLGVAMGIELITLPQGSQLRKDLIERTECLKLLVAISVLKIEDLEERAELISRWIQVAVDTKTAMGNLYGFTGIMLGLCIPEIQRLSQTWMLVRRNYTDSAFKFESKLRSTLKSMNECSNPQAPNTIIPHLLPFVLLCERDLEDIYSLHNRGDALLQWESQASDYGLQMLYAHLQEGRMFTQNLSLYKRNAELVFGDVVHMEELILDMFRTEFQLKFLFGSKAAYADSDERVQKFQKVIETLSEFCEPTYL